MSVAISTLDNNAQAIMQGNTQLDVLDKITLDAQAENLTGLISQDTTFKYVKPTFINKGQIDSDYSIKQGDLIGFTMWITIGSKVRRSNRKSVSWVQCTNTLVMIVQIFVLRADFNDPTRWELLGDKVTSSEPVAWWRI
ncbi:hypothetical protein [Vibrio taketomensis]|uniref:hypothetical protein n=1 Tax=Vibrio taketomensis TaxID=2572923 RepID=UPI00138962C6|nr:hypothetical protein [Vibrio taketomensis]